ncbi:nuclear transport factor 2 family protein [Streptomyces sp. KLOTTS4A1]|uniref:nuclear transport factor 2 family protein n=1 Tax=Streptomyces sp. KLOTTS4A1 TaxID=3390996 RepID=UPI0039F55678
MEQSGCVHRQRGDEFPAAELLAAERRLREAVQEGDPSGLHGLLRPYLVSVRPDGTCLRTGRETVERDPGELVVDRIEPEETVSTVVGATGVTRTVLCTEGHYAGVPFERRVLCTRTWAYEEDTGWQVLTTRVGEVEPGA